MIAINRDYRRGNLHVDAAGHTTGFVDTTDSSGSGLSENASGCEDQRGEETRGWELERLYSISPDVL